MKTSIAVVVLLVVAVGHVYTQPPPPIPGSETPALPGFPPAAQPPAPESAPKERSVNQLLDEIQQIRVQKAELEKKEQALIAEVRKLLDQQNDRLNKMGLGAPVQPPALDIAPPGLAPEQVIPRSGSTPSATPGVVPPAPSLPAPGKR